MKKCNHCNADNFDNARFCDSCGVKFDDVIDEPTVTEEPIINEQPQESEHIPTEETENFAAQEPTINEAPRVENTPPYTQNPYVYNTAFNPYYSQRKHGGLMAFSIINICSIIFSVFTLYASFFTMILGIISVAILNKAKNEPNDEYYKIQKKNALILNIVGLVLAVLGFIAFMAMVVYFIVTGINGLETTIL